MKAPSAESSLRHSAKGSVPVDQQGESTLAASTSNSSGKRSRAIYHGVIAALSGILGETLQMAEALKKAPDYTQEILDAANEAKNFFAQSAHFLGRSAEGVSEGIEALTKFLILNFDDPEIAYAGRKLAARWTRGERATANPVFDAAVIAALDAGTNEIDDAYLEELARTDPNFREKSKQAKKELQVMNAASAYHQAVHGNIRQQVTLQKVAEEMRKHFSARGALQSELHVGAVLNAHTSALRALEEIVRPRVKTNADASAVDNGSTALTDSIRAYWVYSEAMSVGIAASKPENHVVALGVSAAEQLILMRMLSDAVMQRVQRIEDEGASPAVEFSTLPAAAVGEGPRVVVSREPELPPDDQYKVTSKVPGDVEVLSASIPPETNSLAAVTPTDERTDDVDVSLSHVPSGTDPQLLVEEGDDDGAAGAAGSGERLVDSSGKPVGGGVAVVGGVVVEGAAAAAEESSKDEHHSSPHGDTTDDASAVAARQEAVNQVQGSSQEPSSSEPDTPESGEGRPSTIAYGTEQGNSAEDANSGDNLLTAPESDALVPDIEGRLAEDEPIQGFDASASARDVNVGNGEVENAANSDPQAAHGVSEDPKPSASDASTALADELGKGEGQAGGPPATDDAQLQVAEQAEQENVADGTVGSSAEFPVDKGVQASDADPKPVAQSSDSMQVYPFDGVPALEAPSQPPESSSSSQSQRFRSSAERLQAAAEVAYLELQYRLPDRPAGKFDSPVGSFSASSVQRNAHSWLVTLDSNAQQSGRAMETIALLKLPGDEAAEATGQEVKGGKKAKKSDKSMPQIVSAAEQLYAKKDEILNEVARTSKANAANLQSEIEAFEKAFHEDRQVAEALAYSIIVAARKYLNGGEGGSGKVESKEKLEGSNARSPLTMAPVSPASGQLGLRR